MAPANRRHFLRVSASTAEKPQFGRMPTQRQIQLYSPCTHARTNQAEERLRARTVWTDNDLVFCNAVGNPIEPSHLLYRNFRPLLERAGLPAIRFHDLRHTAATLLIEAGMNIVFISELLGHASILITQQHYGHVTPTMHSQALALRSGLYS